MNWNQLTDLAHLAELSDKDDPQWWKLPHKTFREYQLDSIIWALSVDGFGLLEAPTGSGKTGIAAATAMTGQTIAVCRTKNLQKVNYGQMYNAKVLFGKGNYRCAHPENEGASCAECLYVSKSMDRECEYSDECGYLQAKWAARGAQFASLNYAYLLLTRGHTPDALFLDEAHQIPDAVLDFVGCTVYEDDLTHWDLPFPPEANGTRGASMLFPAPKVGEIVRPWLGTASDVLLDSSRQLREMDSALGRKEAVRCERMKEKIGRTRAILEEHPDDWFIVSGQRAMTMGGRRRPVFIARPLTARHHLPAAFLVAPRTILMSATIGKPEVLAEELGIDEYVSRAVPNQWEASRRPVRILDAPRLSHKSEEKDYDKQADVIAEAIKGCDPSWSGLIHVTRKKEARLLADRLAHRGLQDRIWVMPGWDGAYVPTDHQVGQWHDRLKRVSNSICLSWALQEGYDGLDEKIDICAKIQFPYLGDPYEKARMEYSGNFYRQRTAYALEQSLGRTRRGREQDYDTQDERRGLVAIADGNYSRVKKYMSESLQEALLEDI